MKHRMCRVLLCLVLTFALLLPMTVGALADTTIGTDASRPEYFEALGGSGNYNPLKTPYHYDRTTGNVAYCLEHKKDSPSSSAAYTDFDPSALWGHNTVTGIQAIVDHGYPNSTGGLTEEQAHYATANAIRAWMKESADVGYNFMRVDEGHIRPLSGTAAQETWVFFLELLGYARAGATLGGTSGGMELHADHLMLGDQYARVLFCQTYPSFLLDRTVRELASLPANLVLSIDLIPVSTDEAVGEAEKKLLGAETNITNWQRKQNQNNNFSAVVPYDMEEQRNEMREMLSDLRTRDQRLLFAVVTLVHIADSKAQLDGDTDSLQALGRQRACQFTTLRYQQLEGLNTALPYGVRKIDTFRTLITEAAGALMPFSAQEVVHKNGIYHGLSPINKNMIFVNRRQLLNGNGCILGVSGSGKSFFGKMEIVPLMLKGGVDILILDSEAEYLALTQQLGGEVIHISASSPHHINVMDMARGYGDESNPLILKSEFILSLFEQLYLANSPTGGAQQTVLFPRQKSILDRCVANVYREYLRSDYTAQPPTLHDLHAELLRQPEPESKALALDVEMYVTGSLNTFARQTNVNLESSLIAFEIRELGSALQPLGMLVILDAIYNRLLTNRQKGRETWIFVDEAYLLFRSPYSANFFYKLWKRIRKQNGFATAITQNVEELLASDTARMMLSNSEYLVLLNQAPTDRALLSSVLHIPDAQLSYAVNVPQGQGVLKCGSAIVPFVDHFPTDTQLYRLMTTKPSDLYGTTEEGTEPHDERKDTQKDEPRTAAH